ncbi:DUF262 domain-containing protein [Dermacoccaceae bacterium W4C1]
MVQALGWSPSQDMGAGTKLGGLHVAAQVCGGRTRPPLVVLWVQDQRVETFKRTPLQLFNLPQHFMIPLFQRSYVWREEEQWEPLWNDVRRVAEMRIADPRSTVTHFLGAVVLQAHEAQSKRLTAWNVIDGQQRLTTLQLFADASASVLAERGFVKLAEQLEDLTHNSEKYVEDSESRLKLRHLNNDRLAFDEVMTAEPPVDHATLTQADSQLVAAHRYFSTVVEQWLLSEDDSAAEDRAKALADVLLDGLQMVSIELEASENSQEIFETLNARGTPLSAADLVRTSCSSGWRRKVQMPSAPTARTGPLRPSSGPPRSASGATT